MKKRESGREVAKEAQGEIMRKPNSSELQNTNVNANTTAWGHLD